MTTVLIDHARRILQGGNDVSHGQAAQLAALLLRRALEEICTERCAALIDRLDHPVTMRSRLIVLRSLGDREVANDIEVAWMGLSTACHHHAYELPPTTAEVSHLMTIVARLDSQANGDGVPGT